MAAFNDHVQADERTENVLLSVRDGVTLIRLRAAGPARRSRLAFECSTPSQRSSRPPSPMSAATAR